MDGWREARSRPENVENSKLLESDWDLLQEVATGIGKRTSLECEEGWPRCEITRGDNTHYQRVSPRFSS